MEQSSIKPFTFFDKKLGSVMELINISNIQLSKYINVDPSLISRFRSGQRTPKSNPKLVADLCLTLLDRVHSQNKTEELLTLIGASSDLLRDEDTLYISFQNWLCDYQSDDAEAIRNLLQTVSDFSLSEKRNLLPVSQIITDKVLCDNHAVYRGKTGMQQVVIRFLGQALSAHATELFLYSDENMDWMTTPEFQPVWISLMAACLNHGIKIKIIHNIERNVAEMTTAIECWLPLYMSGMIEPYYSRKKQGSLFSHTLFLCPGVACIASCNPINIGEQSLCEYYTDSSHLNYQKLCFEKMLENCNLLVNTQRIDSTSAIQEHLPNSGQLFENIAVKLDTSSVTVVRKDKPRIAFTFYHPLMLEAFQKYFHTSSILPS